MRFKMFNKFKNRIKSFFSPTKKWYPYYWNERELKQKRVCDNWTISMLAEYYEVNEYFMREVLDFYNIK